jgi:hypothetical protein
MTPRPDAEPLIQLLSLIQGKNLRTLVLIVPLHGVSIKSEEVHLTFDNPQWKVLDELTSDVERFAVLGKVTVVVEYLDVDYMFERLDPDSDSALFQTDKLVHTVKKVFKGLISTRRLQLILRCITIFSFNRYLYSNA